MSEAKAAVRMSSEVTGIRDGGSPLAITVWAFYSAINDTELGRALLFLDPRVDWPNTIEGGRLRGRDAVRAYWRRLPAVLIPRIEVIGWQGAGDSTVVAELRQVYRDPAGVEIAHQHTRQAFRLEDRLIVRMDCR
jgi:hypothetical protein